MIIRKTALRIVLKRLFDAIKITGSGLIGKPPALEAGHHARSIRVSLIVSYRA